MTEWSEWIENDGRGTGVKVGYYVHCLCLDGTYLKGWVGEKSNNSKRNKYSWLFNWFRGRRVPVNGIPIVRYRIRKPRALQDLIKLAEDLPEQVPA